MKGAGMLVVSVRGVTSDFGPSKGCSVLGITPLYLAVKVLLRVAREGIYKIIYF